MMRRSEPHVSPQLAWVVKQVRCTLARPTAWVGCVDVLECHALPSDDGPYGARAVHCLRTEVGRITACRFAASPTGLRCLLAIQVSRSKATGPSSSRSLSMPYTAWSEWAVSEQVSCGVVVTIRQKPSS
jgi:hypothetical protein